MNQENKNITHYMFYLQTKKELDAYYYEFSRILKQVNIILLPISPTDLVSLKRKKPLYLISIRNDLASAGLFKEVNDSFIARAMGVGEVLLFDISSFSEIENSAKLKTKETYHFYQLPISLKEVALSIASVYFTHQSLEMEWPGGRRSRLPSAENQS